MRGAQGKHLGHSKCPTSTSFLSSSYGSLTHNHFHMGVPQDEDAPKASPMALCVSNWVLSRAKLAGVGPLRAKATEHKASALRRDPGLLLINMGCEDSESDCQFCCELPSLTGTHTLLQDSHLLPSPCYHLTLAFQHLNLSLSVSLSLFLSLSFCLSLSLARINLPQVDH